MSAGVDDNTVEEQRDTASLPDIYRWVRPALHASAQRSFRQCCSATRAAHDREEASLFATSRITSRDVEIPVAEMARAIGGILSRGCRPDALTLSLETRGFDAQQTRGLAALACFTTAGVNTVTRLSAQHLDITPQVAAAAATVSPALNSLSLLDCRLCHLASLVNSVNGTLMSLSLVRCGGLPPGISRALLSCGQLRHLTLLYDSCTAEPLTDDDAGGHTYASASSSAMEVARFCAALGALTQLRSLNLDLQLPLEGYTLGQPQPCRTTASYTEAADDAGADGRHWNASPNWLLVESLGGLTGLTRLEIGEAGSAPHPDWRLCLLDSIARLPCLGDLSWRRLECDTESLSALSSASSLTSMYVEKFRAPAQVAQVALAAAAAAAAAAAVPPPSEHAGAAEAVAAAAAARTAAAATVAARTVLPPAARPTAADGTEPAEPIWRRLLLPLPPNLRELRARYSGLGGMSLAALSALQPPPGLVSLELRNPKLEVGNGDVEQPSGQRLLPEAALALGLGLRKLAQYSPQLHTLRIINESGQRNALAAPVGWAEVNGGGGGGVAAAAAGGGHVPWLSSLGGLRSLRRLTLSGFMLGQLDAEVLARQATALEELYLVPLGSISSAAVPVLRGMGLRRLVLPYERHA